MSRRTLAVALAVVSLALAATVGLLIGTRVGRGGSGQSQALSTARPTSRSSPSSNQLALTPIEQGVVSTNLACEYLDAPPAHYFVTVVSIHGVDVGASTPDAGDVGLIDVERQEIQDVHNALAAAAVHDQRWNGLQALVARDESAAIAIWDRGGFKPIDAVVKAVGTDEDTIHGDCEAAKGELQTTAQSRQETPQALLKLGGATDIQVRNWG
jgi:hypothetical protein